MKKLFYKQVFFCALLFVPFSCNKIGELSEYDTDQLVFTATFEDNSAKVTVDNHYNLFWQSDDHISIFGSPVNEKYSFVGQDGDNIGKFEKTDNVQESVPTIYPKFYAVYPYQENTEATSEGVISFDVRTVTHFEDGKLKDNLMIGATESLDDTRISFKNVLAYIKLSLYGGDYIKSIVLEGNNSEILAGAVTVSDLNENELNIHASGTSNYVMIDCGNEGFALSEDKAKPTVFFLGFIPQTFNMGFKVTITNTVGDVIVKSTNNPITISRNNIQPISAIEMTNSGSGTKMESFALSIGGVDYPAFNISDNYIDVCVPEEADLADVIAKFTINGISVKVDNVEQTSGLSRQNFSDFTAPVKYTVTSLRGSAHDYYIRVYNLPVMTIDTPDGNPIVSKAVYTENCKICIYGAEGAIYKSEADKVSGRGNATWGAPKKPYKLKLDKKTSLFGIPKSKKWVLLANYNNADKSMMHNALAFEIGKYTTLQWMPKGHYVELFLNGEHKGLYYFCEKVEVEKDRINIDTSFDFDEGGNVSAGGYLMEIDSYYDEEFKFKTAIQELPVMFKDPDENVTEPMITYVKDHFNFIEALVHDKTRLLNREYLPYIDIESFVGWFLVQELARNNEVVNNKNGYICKPKDEDKLYMCAPWDFDSWGFRPEPTGWITSMTTVFYPSLLGDPEFKREIKTRWQDLYPICKTEIPEWIDKTHASIRSSALRNYVVWPAEPFSWYEGSSSFDKEIEILKQVFEQRVEWMNSEISKW